MTTTEQNDGNTSWLHCTHWSKIKGLSFCGQKWTLKQLIQCTNSSPLSDCTPSICRSNSHIYRESFFPLRSLLLWETMSGNMCPIQSILYVKTNKNLCLDTNIFMRVLQHMAASHPVESCKVLATYDEKMKELQLFWPLEI